MPEVWSEWKKWILTAGAVGFLLFYFLFDPVQTKFMPQCLFHKFTGLQCIGCGSQRMIHALLHGNFADAFRANALIVILLPLILIFLYAELRKKRYPKLYAGLHRPWVIITAAALFVIWLPLRNILGI